MSNVHPSILHIFTTLFIADTIYNVFFSEVLLETPTAENNPTDVVVLGASESTLGSDSGVETGFDIKRNAFLYINDA